MGLDFQQVARHSDEQFDPGLPGDQVAMAIARQKAAVFSDLAADHVVLTADTVVASDTRILGKPRNRADAIAMIESLSGQWHTVWTAICLTHGDWQDCHTEGTRVKFALLDGVEIEHYVDTHEPFDKAGAYGIQEWIGLVGIERIEGDYHTVMGLPTQRLWTMLKQLAERERR